MRLMSSALVIHVYYPHFLYNTWRELKQSVWPKTAGCEGVAPLEYLRRIGLAAARAAPQSGRNVTQAAELAGFRSDTPLRRAWHQFGLDGTPSVTTRSLFN